MDESKTKDDPEPSIDKTSRKRPLEDSPKSEGKRVSGRDSPARLRPRSAPPPPAHDEAERAALARVLLDPDALRRMAEQLSEQCDSESGEEDDPLLSGVPSHLDPERLGFLVCAQETLRYLYRRGIPHDHPIFTHLRTRFIRGLNQMGLD